LILIKGFWILEQSSPKSCELIKKYHEDIFFHPKKFSRIDPSINEPLKQYIDLGLNRLCSRVLAATVILKPRSTLSFRLGAANDRCAVGFAFRRMLGPQSSSDVVDGCVGKRAKREWTSISGLFTEDAYSKVMPL